MTILNYLDYLEKKFWAKVNVINDDNSCWEWTKEKDKWGYGVINIYEGTKKIKITFIIRLKERPHVEENSTKNRN